METANTRVLCSICKQRGSSVEAMIWCFLCDEAYCKSCKEHHELSKYTKTHQPITALKYEGLHPFIKDINQFCIVHNEKFEFFCSSDSVLCCRRCISDAHSKCTEYICIERLLVDSKIPERFQKLKAEINGQSSNLEMARKDRENNKKLLKEQKEKYRNDIQSIRKKINECFDEIETKFEEELKYTTEVQLTEISKVVEDVDKCCNNVSTLESDLEAIEHHPNNLQKFCGLLQLEKRINDTGSDIKELFESDKFDRINVEMSISNTISAFLGKTKSLGKIHVVNRPKTLQIKDPEYFQCREETLKCIPNHVCNGTISLLLLTKVQIPKGKAGITITGSTMLPSGDIYVADFSPSKRIVSISSEGILHDDITFSDYPIYDLTYVSGSQLALSTGSYGQIKLFDMSERRTKRTTKIDGNIYGITTGNESLVYCVGNKSLKELKISDESVRDIPSGKLKNKAYVCFSNNLYYFTDQGNESVCCCDVKGQMQWKFSSERLKRPRGIVVHSVGDVYVVGEQSNNLIFISGNGTKYTELLTQEDGLKKPTSVSINNDTKTLVVCNSEGLVFIFKMMGVKA